MLDTDFERISEAHMKECKHCHTPAPDQAWTCTICGGQEFKPWVTEYVGEPPRLHVDACRAVVWDHPDEWEDEVEVEKVAQWKDLH